MFQFLPEDVQKGLEAAQRRAQRKGSRLSVHVGDLVLPILRLWETGFAVDARTAPRLRGFVDIFDGPRHVSNALIIAASEDGDDMIYEFKRDTQIPQAPIRDYVDDRAPLGGYLSAPR